MRRVVKSLNYYNKNVIIIINMPVADTIHIKPTQDSPDHKGRLHLPFEPYA